MFVAGSTAYVVDGSLRVVDVSDPGSPSIVGSAATAGYAQDVEVIGSVAFIADENGAVGVDVSDPAAPVLMGTIPTLRPAEKVAVSQSTSTVWLASGVYLEGVDVACPVCNGLEVVASPATILIGSTATITVTVRDVVGQPVPGQAVTAVSDTGTVGSFTDNGDGTYEATYTTGSHLGTVEITLTVNDETCNPIGAVEIVCPTFALTMTPDPVQTGGSGALGIAVTDPEGSPVAGFDLDAVVTAGTVGDVVDGGDGTYTAAYTAPASPATVTATVRTPEAICTEELVFDVLPCSTPLVVSSETISDARTIQWCGDIHIGPAVALEATADVTFQAGGTIEVENGLAVESGATVTFALGP